MKPRNAVAAATLLTLAAIAATLVFGRAQTARPVVAPRPGVFLVARPGMPDPRFARAVVLLIEHGPSGSMGLIVNRPSDHPVGEFFPEFGAAARRHTLWFGGPVAPYLASFLVRAAEPLPGTIPVLGSLRYGADSATLAMLMERGSGPDELHVYLGYAGWGPGQLDGELLNGDWFLARATERDVMAPGALWDRLMERREPTGILVRQFPPGPPDRRTVSF
jgi:putative transcriptional regulator